MWYRDPKVRARSQLAADLRDGPSSTFARSGLERQDAVALAEAFRGRLVFPDSPGYDQDRKLDNPVFDYRPPLIAYCLTEGDVALVLAATQRVGTTFRIRGGGHSTGGYSEADQAWVLDVSSMANVATTTDGTVTVDAGASLDAVLVVLERERRETVTGGCPSVGYAGYMQGGGYGFTSRQYGMSVDTVLGARVMLGDGRIVTADATTNPDLFFAIRGGTGNTFGVLLQTTVATFPARHYQGLTLMWDIDDAAAVLHELQVGYMGPDHPSLGFQVLVCSYGDITSKKLVLPMMSASGDIRGDIASLLALPGHTVSWEGTGSYTEVNSDLLSKLLSPPNPLSRTLYEAKRCGYVGSVLGVDVWQQFLAYLQTSPRPFDQFVIEPYGGAITEPTSPNAFVHREVMCDLILDTFWEDPTGEAVARSFLAGFIDYGTGGGVATPHLTGRIYQDYPQPDLADWADRYWDRATFDVLRRVKAKYDPANVFRFPQSIPPDNADLTAPPSHLPFAPGILDHPIQ